MNLAPGTHITHNVRLVRPLGEGGMGRVWVADHLGLDTQVAVKFISAELVSKQPELVARFKREAAAAAKIRSPHVVQVFDHGLMGNGTPFIVMELLEGESLGARVQRLGRLGVEEVVEIVKQTAKALTEAHALGVVHRDIKPDNIFLTVSAGELHAKVLDFGIAKQQMADYDSLTGTATLMGTPEYMSPEQLVTPKDVDHRADLWALSVVAYETLTGSSPFVAETTAGLIMVIGNCQYSAPSERTPGLHSALDNWFARGFAREPAQRFSSAKELATAFKTAATGEAISSGEWRAPVAAHTQLGSMPPMASSSTATVFGAPLSVAPGSVARPGTFDGASATLNQRRKRGVRTFALLSAAIGAVLVVVVGAIIMLGNEDESADAVPAAIPAEEPMERADDAEESTEGTVDDAEKPEGGAFDAPDQEAAVDDDPQNKPYEKARERRDTPASKISKPSQQVQEPRDNSKPGRNKPPRERKRRLGF